MSKSSADGLIVVLPSAARRDPGCVRVATAIRRARRLAGVDPARFAKLLSLCPWLGPRWQITAERVAAWEEGLVPPAAVELLAAAEMAGVEVEVLLGGRPLEARLDELEKQLQQQSLQLRHLLDRVS